MESNKKLLNKQKYKIWSNCLLEESLCDDIFKKGSLSTKCEDRNVIQVTNRDVENYQYKIDEDECDQNVSKPRIVSKNHLAFEENHSNFNATCITKSSRPKIVDDTFLNRIRPMTAFDESVSRDHIKANEFDSEEVVAREIARLLKEPKIELISKI